jgi:sec-independent protein translocase protein TatA
MTCGRFGPSELLLLALLFVILFGASRLPEIGRGLGVGIRRFKKGLRDEDEESGKKLADDEPNAKS